MAVARSNQKANGPTPPKAPYNPKAAAPDAPYRPAVRFVDIYLVTDNQRDLVCTLRFRALTAGSRYGELHLVNHPIGNLTLDIPSTAVPRSALIHVLNYLLRVNPPFQSMNRDHNMVFETGQSLSYYIDLLHVVKFLQLKAPMAGQPALVRTIRGYFDHAAIATKKDISLVWNHFGDDEKGILRHALKQMIKYLGMDTDAESRGSAITPSGLTVWKEYQTFFSAELNVVVDDLYTTMLGWLNRLRIEREREAQAIRKEETKKARAMKANEAKETKANNVYGIKNNKREALKGGKGTRGPAKADLEWKAVKDKAFAGGVGTIPYEQGQIYQEMLRRKG